MLQVALPAESPQRCGGFLSVPRAQQTDALHLQYLEGEKPIQLQLTTIQTKRKLGENLYTDEVEAEGVVSKDSETYLDKLRTLMPAYALAGASPLVGVTNPTKEKTLVGLIPEVCRGASRCGHGLPVQSQAVCQLHPGQAATFMAPGVVTPRLKQGQQESHFRGPNINGKLVARVMQDGAVLCPDFRRGKCKATGNCPKGSPLCCGHEKDLCVLERKTASVGPRLDLVASWRAPAALCQRPFYFMVRVPHFHSRLWLFGAEPGSRRGLFNAK